MRRGGAAYAKRVRDGFTSKRIEGTLGTKPRPHQPQRRQRLAANTPRNGNRCVGIVKVNNIYHTLSAAATAHSFVSICHTNTPSSKTNRFLTRFAQSSCLRYARDKRLFIRSRSHPVKNARKSSRVYTAGMGRTVTIWRAREQH